MVNKKNRNQAKKGLSKKSKTEQKENIPKKENINKTFGTIAMSKQLRLEVKTNKSNKHKKHKNSNRVCSNGRAMPSLEDLEKMFEDSDDDNKTIVLDTPQTNTICNRESCDSSISAQSDIAGKLLSTEDTLPDIFKFDLHYLNISRPSSKESSTYIPIHNNNTLIKSYEKEPIQRQQGTSSINIKTIDENIDTNSSNSYKTIEHNLLPDSTFYPLPSTSRDYITIVKNDELFHNSLKKNPHDNNDKILEESSINNSSDIRYPSVLNDRNSIKYIDEDDDCMIIDSDIDSIQIKTKHTDFIDLESISNEPNVNLHPDKTVAIEDDIIDVDALIAENQSIVKKYQLFQQNIRANTNRIVDVSDKNDSSLKHQPQRESIQTITPENNIGQSPENDQPEVIFVSEILPSTIPNHQPSTIDNQCENSHSHSSFSVKSINCIFNNIIMANPDNIMQTNVHVDLQKNHTQMPQPQILPEVVPINSRNNQPTRDNPHEIVDTAVPDFQNKNVSIKESPSSNKLPTEPLKNLGDCPICIDNLSSKPIASTICGHVFCMECLNRAIKSNKRCPTCRKILKNKSSYHQIFL